MSVDTWDRCLRNVNAGQVISYFVRWIPEVLIMEDKPCEDGRIHIIIDTREQYSDYAQCFSAKQEARLPEHKFWHQQIPL